MQERPWALKVLRVLVPVTALVLVIQYIAGLGTNVYAPAGGFTNNTDYGWLDFHYTVGDVVGILSILLVIIAVFTARAALIGNSVGVLLGVLIAGFAGSAFVSTNNPVDSIVMGIGFLIAFGAAVALAFRVMAAASSPGAPKAPVGAIAT